MALTLFASLSGVLLGWLMGFLSLFLILLILIQRGKGGGLSGALGGPGGQSAFGSKAGDTFTLITVVVATIWGFTCAFTMWSLGTHAPAPVTNNTSINQTDTEDGAGDLSLPSLTDGGVGTLSLGDDADDAEPKPEMAESDADQGDESASTEEATGTDAGEAASSETPEDAGADSTETP